MFSFNQKANRVRPLCHQWQANWPAGWLAMAYNQNDDDDDEVEALILARVRPLSGGGNGKVQYCAREKSRIHTTCRAPRSIVSRLARPN